MTALNELKSRLFQLTNTYKVGFTPDMCAAGGIETHPAGSAYRWDGMKRHGNPDEPFFLFQYTLDGVGHYVEGGQHYELIPGTAFATIVPSEHAYFVSDNGPSWHFFWLIIRHPYVVMRMKALRESMPPVLRAEPDDALMAAALGLLNSIFVRGVIWDQFAEEELVFKLMLAFERFHHEQIYSGISEQEVFLGPARNYIVNSLHRPISVQEIADLYGLSRSHFSHRFRSMVGLSPAQFILRMRLNQAIIRMLETDDTLEQIAQETGFADANHFNKVFRKHYHLTPGQFRRQMRQN